jgi:hypothetical protein
MFYLLVWTRAPASEAYIVVTSSMSLMLRWPGVIAIHMPEKDFWRVDEASDEKVTGYGHAPKDLWES